MLKTSESPREPENEDLVTRFQHSKSGWRRKSSTATRQALQLRNMFKKVSEVSGESRPDVIMRKHGDELEEVVRADLPGHTALVKSNVIALTEFAKYVSSRQPEYCAEWASINSRLQTWKRDASALDLHRVADLQDKMGEEGYLPSKDELKELRRRTLEELAVATKVNPKQRNEAVKVRRLVSVSRLCDNFQRSGAISNVMLREYQNMTGNVLRVAEHKSKASYGSVNLVVGDQVLKFLHLYVEKFRPMLSKGDQLFPTSKVANDVAAVCSMFGLRPFNPTLMRKAMGSAAYGNVNESQRKKIANHMTHRPETAFKAYAANNRRTDAVESVSVMADLMYGEGPSGGTGAMSELQWEESTVPSSAGAMAMDRERFSESQTVVLEQEARRLKDSDRFVSTARALQIMSRHKPLFDCRSPKSVEDKLRSLLARARECDFWPLKGVERVCNVANLGQSPEC